MPKEYTVQEWSDQINLGLEFRHQYGLEEKWAKVEAMYYNAHPSSDTSASNILYATGDAFLSLIHQSNPYILAEPTTLREVAWAPIIESMDNQLLCEMGLPEEMEKASLYSYLWGTAFVKIGYDSEFGWDPKLDIGGRLEPQGKTLTQINSTQTSFIEFRDIQPGMPWTNAMLPHDVVFPWGTFSVKDAPWYAHRICRHVDYIKADPKYTNKNNLKGVMSQQDFVESYQTIMKPYRLGPDLLEVSANKEGSPEFCELWEIHDKRTRKIYVIATGHKKFLRNDVDHLQIKGLPIVEVGFVPKTRSIWRTSDACYLLNHQAEINDIAIQARKQRRFNVLKFLYRDGMINREALNKLLSKNVGAAIPVQGAGDLNQAFVPLSQSNPNTGLYEEAMDVRNSARETVGFDRNSFGEYRGARTTATEVESVQSSKMARMDRRGTNLARAYTDTMEKVNKICFRYWTAPKVVQVIGPENLPIWVDYIPREMMGDYKLKLYMDDPGTPTVQGRQQEAQGIYQQSFMDPTIDPLYARRMLAQSYASGRVAAAFGSVMQGGVPQMGQGPGGPPASGVQQGRGTQGSRGKPSSGRSPSNR